MKIIENHLKQLISALVRSDWSGIEHSGQAGHLTAKEISDAIENYPGKLESTTISAHDINTICYAWNGRSGLIEYDLRYEGEKSDLTLIAEFDLDRVPVLTIDSIRVL